ncbi:2-dehydro-3-deoxygalactonokinase [Pantoea sp. At-9b]|uniref:2-dehydro-3-deoxygalactonokinase n=1 Tax=Pantoea sp. (strain At-9b) TaxID=592316 RepID=UPI0001B403E0|nr:2-dehydro-3-deoxygalactonokinase [Pantoea sp. At-9b]ADU72404.1 2-dehydro-3-deoxygalactonokinase [Pantoea sp. At-9b]
MSNTAEFGLCDWGTSSFRLWLVDGKGTTLNEVRTHQGLGSVAERSFSGVLEQHLAELGASADLPVLICGMAGSRQGWQDAGYSTVPLTVNALLLSPIRIAGARDIRILPGVCQRSPTYDVMRGEETMLLGAVRSGQLNNGLIVMPGTHSKWVSLENGVVTGFNTFMTGELFSLMSTHSILRHAVADAIGEIDEHSPAFIAAVNLMLSGGSLTQQLFTVRSTTLLSDCPPAESASRLSGLLIGAEVAACYQQTSQRQVMLIASGSLTALYRKALTLAGFAVTLVDADEAVRAGLFQSAQTLWQRQEEQQHV